MSSAKRIHAVAALAGVSVALGIGCEGPTAPRTVQAGSSLAIPFVFVADGAHPVGFGGTAVTIDEDYQRGRMVFRLVDQAGNPAPAPNELEARMTSVATPSNRVEPATVYLLGEQLVSLVDVPDDADPDEYWLLPIRRRIEGGQVWDTEWPEPLHFPITVLPKVIDVPIIGQVIGEPTPFASWRPYPHANLDSPVLNFLPWAVPHPAVEISLTKQCTGTCDGTRRLAALDLDVTYDPAVIDVVSVVPTHDASHVIWIQDDQTGSLQVGIVDPDVELLKVFLVFTLDNGSQAILDPTNTSHLDITVTGAADQDGASLLDEYIIDATPGLVY